MISISSKWYDILKNFTLIILPGAGTMYFALASIWGLPYGEEVVGTLAAIAVFLGLFLRSSSKTYANDPSNYDGVMDVIKSPEEPNKMVYRLAFNDEDAVPDLQNQKTVTFAVNK